ncbi:DNA primase [Streptomyces sp. WG-D5]
MNRTALGLAIGAGYVLGRTKKMKFALAVGTAVAGKRLNLSPRAVMDLVQQQLQNNPQFKEIGDQLREDVRGVGKAATGALVNRQIEGLADRLHDRTAGVRDQLSGVAPDTDDVRGAGKRATGLLRRRGERQEEPEPEEEAYDEDEPYESDADSGDVQDDDERDDQDEHDAHDAHEDDEERSRGGAAMRTAEKAPPRKTAAKNPPAKKAPGKKAAAKKAPARKAPAKKTAGAGPRAAKGGRSRG